MCWGKRHWIARATVISAGCKAQSPRETIKDPAGKAKEMTYDIAGRLKAVKSPGGSSISYDYDKLNELVSKTYEDEPAKDVMYSYDMMGQRISMGDESGESKYTYDILGRISSVTNAKGKTVSYEYDEADLISKITYADGSHVAYGYDKNDRLTSVRDKNGETAYTYDAAGRVTGISRPGGIDTSYTYDKRSNISRIENRGGGELISSFDYEYDGRSYIISETAVDESGETVRGFSYNEAGELTSSRETGPSGSYRYEYSYDDAGNRTKQIRTGTGDSEIITYTYDAGDRLTLEVSSLNGRTEYGYDANGNLTSKDGAGSSYTYEYTVENRLKAVREGGSLLMATAYDGDGGRVFQVNRKSVTYPSFDKSDKEVSEKDSKTGTDTEEADESKSKSFLNAFRDVFKFGFFTSVHEQVRPVIMANKKADESFLSWIGHFWNGVFRGERYSSEDIDDVGSLGLPPEEEQAILSGSVTIPDYTEGKTGGYEYELIYYVNDVNQENVQVLSEYSAGEVKADYTYGNERISADFSSTASMGVGKDYYLYDGRGSVSEVVDSAGAVLSDYSYDPFGGTTEGADKETTVFAYNGEEYNPNTGLQYLRARYYDTGAGRFTTEDTRQGSPVNPLSQNKYAYAMNNPINFNDPTGHFFETIKKVLKNAGNAVKNILSGGKNEGKNGIKNAVPSGQVSLNNNLSGQNINMLDSLKKGLTQLGKAAKAFDDKIKKFSCNAQNRISTFLDKNGTKITQTIAVVFVSLVVAGAAVTVVGGGATVGLGTAVVSKSPAVVNVVSPAVKTVINQIVKTAPKVIPRVINKIIDGAQDEKNKKPSTGNSLSGYGDKSENYLTKRGWTWESAQNVVEKPYTMRETVNRATLNPATAFYNKAGDYVVRDDVTGMLVQVSKFGDTEWIPDSSIINPYKP